MLAVGEPWTLSCGFGLAVPVAAWLLWSLLLGVLLVAAAAELFEAAD